MIRNHYDFSKGDRGKFYRKGAKCKFPVYLDDEVIRYFSARAEDKGVELDVLINNLLKKEIDLIEAVR